MRYPRVLIVALVCGATVLTHATIFGSLRGIIHDPHHRPIAGAAITVRSLTSDWSQTTTSADDGVFRFIAVPVGQYSVTVSGTGFAEAVQNVVVQSGTEPVLHFGLHVAAAQETVNVSGAPEAIPTDSSTPTTLVTRSDVGHTPGADRTNSLAMITDFVPGAYITHDQLHIRGGHQVSWLLDGVPVPNNSMASNVGPQFDPKDIDYLEVLRGSYGAEFGDRTYGVFNIVPRTGFERNREAELVASFGSFYQTNDQLSFGSHTENFAYYVGVNGNRSNYGLQTPVAAVIHDAENGYGGFASFIYNPNPANQVRLVTSLRRDYYQIPYDPDPNSPGNQQYNSSGLRDAQREADALANFSWLHTFSPQLLLTVSPFYHFNRADYRPNPNDLPSATTDDTSSHYAGGQISLSANFAHNNLQAGGYGFGQYEQQVFGVVFNDGSSPNFTDRESGTGGVGAFFVDDKLKLTPWLTLIAGIRPTHFSGQISESAISPRVGAALVVPRLKWVLRGFYGDYYQAPPLLTVSGPLLQFVNSQNLSFIPLHGERDREYQLGITIPYRGWTLDADNFKTVASNFLDHTNVGESNLFFPITLAQAVIRGWELTLRSPRLGHRGQLHLAYSNQIAQGQGAITGGLTDFSPPAPVFSLDHDQRNTLNVGGDMALPWNSFAGSNVYYGSGFTNGFPPPAYLPGHVNIDLMLGKQFGERFAISVNVLNAANRRLLIDNSLSFGGFHWNDPRQIYAQVRYRFHY
jgi:outer membrane cobalamin receptor